MRQDVDKLVERGTISNTDNRDIGNIKSEYFWTKNHLVIDNYE